MGTFINKVDQKKRVSVPFEFRTLLIKEDCQALICFPSLTGECLEGGGDRYFEKLHTMIGAMDPYDEAREALEDAIIGASLRLHIDRDGRITLNDQFNQYAHIDGEVAFVGLGEKFQIWNPAILEKHRLKQREIARQSRSRMKTDALAAAQRRDGDEARKSSEGGGSEW